MITSAAFSFAFNLLYALYHFAVGIMNMSLWFVAMGTVYWILATMRFSAVLCGRRNDNLASEDTEYFVMKLTGAFFILLSCVLAAVIYISLVAKYCCKARRNNYDNHSRLYFFQNYESDYQIC